MSVIAGPFRRKSIRERERAETEPEYQEGTRRSFITWGSLATFVVSCTIVGTALFLGSRVSGPP